MLTSEQIRASKLEAKARNASWFHFTLRHVDGRTMDSAGPIMQAQVDAILETLAKPQPKPAELTDRARLESDLAAILTTPAPSPIPPLAAAETAGAPVLQSMPPRAKAETDGDQQSNSAPVATKATPPDAPQAMPVLNGSEGKGAFQPQEDSHGQARTEEQRQDQPIPREGHGQGQVSQRPEPAAHADEREPGKHSLTINCAMCRAPVPAVDEHGLCAACEPKEAVHDVTVSLSPSNPDAGGRPEEPAVSPQPSLIPLPATPPHPPARSPGEHPTLEERLPGAAPYTRADAARAGLADAYTCSDVMHARRAAAVATAREDERQMLAAFVPGQVNPMPEEVKYVPPLSAEGGGSVGQGERASAGTETPAAAVSLSTPAEPQAGWGRLNAARESIGEALELARVGPDTTPNRQKVFGIIGTLLGGRTTGPTSLVANLFRFLGKQPDKLLPKAAAHCLWSAPWDSLCERKVKSSDAWDHVVKMWRDVGATLDGQPMLNGADAGMKITVAQGAALLRKIAGES